MAPSGSLIIKLKILMATKVILSKCSHSLVQESIPLSFQLSILFHFSSHSSSGTTFPPIHPHIYLSFLPSTSLPILMYYYLHSICFSFNFSFLNPFHPLHSFINISTYCLTYPSLINSLLCLSIYQNMHTYLPNHLTSQITTHLPSYPSI